MTLERTIPLKKLVRGGAQILTVAAPFLACLPGLPNASAQSPAPRPSDVTPIASERENIAGTWQGSLSIGNRESRVVFKISLDDGRLSAVMYSIDQGGEGTPASAITQNGSAIKIAVAAITGSYEGKLAANGKTIAGTWTQGVLLPLNLARATPKTAWVIPEAQPAPKPMPADAPPVFEVASIKPSESLQVLLRLSPSGVFDTSGTSLSDLIKFAYDLHLGQITGGPSWLQSERYDVTAKPEKPGRPSGEQLKVMVRGLLGDRFHLAFHHEQRELPVYAITVAKSGLKMLENHSDPNGLPTFGVGPRSLRLTNATMADLARILQASILDRPAVDRTGLASTKYDCMLKWTPDASQPGGAEPTRDNANPAPDLFTAFQQELGLKLESTKATVDVLVIDRVEKPSAN